MKTDKRVENNLAATLAARSILRSIIQNPEDYVDEESLIAALKSQGGLAKLDYETRIDGKTVLKMPMSLNTLKTYCDRELEDGFEGFDSLRLKAIDAIENYKARSVRPDSRSRVGMQSKIRELEEELDKHRAINFILLQAVQSAMSSIRSVKNAVDPELREKRAEEGMQRLRAITKLNPPPFDDTSKPNVVSLKDYKNEK